MLCVARAHVSDREMSVVDAVVYNAVHGTAQTNLADSDVLVCTGGGGDAAAAPSCCGGM